MEIPQEEIFIQMGQLYAENSQLKKQHNSLIQENQQLRAALQLKTVPAVIDIAGAPEEQTAQQA